MRITNRTRRGLSAALLLLGAFSGVGLLAGCSERSTPTPTETPTATSTETATAETTPADTTSGDSITDMSAVALAAAIRDGELSAREVTQAHLDRIAALNQQGPELRAVLAVNPAALAEADALDARLAEAGPAGPLHGVPVLIKGNIDINGMVSSAGSLALVDGVMPVNRDAFIVGQLRAAGAVILGTANLSEWANFRDQKSSSGWSSQGGQTRNPHVLDRNPCGSSSGSAAAVAARLAPLAIGTETNGSVVCPASANGVVGIKPTVGLVSRSGIIPISSTQDTAGPMGRSVADAALLLEVIAGFDDQDAASIQAENDSTFQPDPEVTRLDGRRIGVLRSYGGAGERPRLDALYQRTVALLPTLGATVVDPIEYEPSQELRGAAYRILLREFKATLNAYLAGRLIAGRPGQPGGSDRLQRSKCGSRDADLRAEHLSGSAGTNRSLRPGVR